VVANSGSLLLFLFSRGHQRTAWGSIAKKLTIIWAKFSTFGQSLQLHSHVSEVVSIFPIKAK